MQEADKASLRNDLVPAMIALSAPTDKTVRVQIAESISLIASVDFPEPWSDLIDVRVMLGFSGLTASLMLLDTETRQFAITDRLFHKHWCTANCPFYLPALACRDAIRLALQRHQLRPGAVQQTVLELVPDYSAVTIDQCAW